MVVAALAARLRASVARISVMHRRTVALLAGAASGLGVSRPAAAQPSPFTGPLRGRSVTRGVISGEGAGNCRNRLARNAPG